MFHRIGVSMVSAIENDVEKIKTTSEVMEPLAAVADDLVVESNEIETPKDVVDSNNKLFVNMAMAEVAMVEQPPILRK